MKRKKRKDFEIRFYEGLIKQKPDFVQALSCLGDAYTRKGFLQEGLAVDKKLVCLRPQNPVFHYNLACSFSLIGDVENSFQVLKKAVLLGYDDYAYILQDEDLKIMRTHPHFKAFFAKIKRMKL